MEQSHAVMALKASDMETLEHSLDLTSSPPA